MSNLKVILPLFLLVCMISFSMSSWAVETGKEKKANKSNKEYEAKQSESYSETDLATEVEIGTAMSPSSRKVDLIVEDLEDEINTKVLEEREYLERSTISRIKEIEEKNEVEVEKQSWISKIDIDNHFEIYINGGGYRHGIDPIIENRIMISNAGLMQKYFKTESGREEKVSKQVDREELMELVKWIAEKGFFSYEKTYECESSACKKRLKQRPQPVPLKVVVAVGQYRNVVSIPIFAPDIDKQELIEYPEELKKIVEAIYVFASL